MNKPTIKNIKPSIEFEKFYFKSSGLRIVPTIYNRESEEVFLYKESGTFAKWIKKNYPKISIDYNSNVKKISLNNNEFWLPLVYLSSDTSIQIYLGLVINFLYDKLKGALSGEKEKAKVNLNIEYKEGDKYKRFEYSGNIEGLEKFTKFNTNNFFEN